jgi:hypothetical protein
MCVYIYCIVYKARQLDYCFYPEVVRHEQLGSKKGWIKTGICQKREKADRIISVT